LSRAKPATPDQKSDPKRRKLILDAAEKLLSHYGPQKTTINDIAREAGIGTGSVYLEFCSKDEIVGELSWRRHRRVLDAMREAAAKGSYAERLTRALEARIRALLEMSREGAHSCDLVLCKSQPVQKAHGRFREDELAFVAELLAAGTQAGELEVKEPRKAAEVVQRAYATFSPPWLFEQDRREVLSAVKAMNELILSGIARRRP
jgi:AcrR family transcriptional regulator